jgi:hypothetical protein
MALEKSLIAIQPTSLITHPDQAFFCSKYREKIMLIIQNQSQINSIIDPDIL